MEQVDEAFIQPIEFRPKQKQEETGDEIPVIDLYNSDKERLVSEIGDACAKWGFFQVINHGVPLDLKEKMEKVAKEFCHQPIEQKKKVARDELNPMGFYESEHTKNVRDWKNVFDFLIQDPTFIPATPHADDTELRTLTNQWPTHPPRFRSPARRLQSRSQFSMDYNLDNEQLDPHSVTEQRRRSKINERFQQIYIRDLTPHTDQKIGTASFLIEVSIYLAMSYCGLATLSTVLMLSLSILAGNGKVLSITDDG